MTTEPATVAAKARKIDKVANGVAKSADREIGAWADRAEAAAKRAETLLKDGVESLRSHTQTYADAAVQRIETAKTAARDKVREKPLTGVVIAAGVGLLVGMLISGRRR